MPQPKVQTVLGQISASKLGATDAHTHLIRLGGPLVDKGREFLLPSVEKAVDELTAFKAAGGGAVVEMTPCGPGREGAKLAEASRASGVHVIAATGFVDWSLYKGQMAWLESATVDQLADLLAAEVLEGMDANNYTGPLVKRIRPRAGAIKLVTGYQVITPFQRKIIKASAQAHRRTGAPISVHTERGTCVLDLVELLAKEKVSPDSVIVAHTFLNPDPGYQRSLAETGVYLIQDGPGRIHYLPESNTVEQIERFLADGFGGQILLAGDHSKTDYWRAYGGGPGFTYILEEFIPRLRKAGVLQADIQSMLIDNPARAFCLRNSM